MKRMSLCIKVINNRKLLESIHTFKAPVICIHAHTPIYAESWAKVQGNNEFLNVPAVPGKCRGFNIGTLTLVLFSVV